MSTQNKSEEKKKELNSSTVKKENTPKKSTKKNTVKNNSNNVQKNNNKLIDKTLEKRDLNKVIKSINNENIEQNKKIIINEENKNSEKKELIIDENKNTKKKKLIIDENINTEKKKLIIDENINTEKKKLIIDEDLNKEKKELIVENTTNTKKIKNNENIKNEQKNIQEENTIKKEKKKEKKEKKIKLSTIIILFFVIFFIILISIFTAFTLINSSKTTITKGVYIHGIDVSDLTKQEATEKIQNYYNEKLSHDITLQHNGSELYVKTSEIELNYNISNSVDSAMQIGKKGNIFSDNYQIFSAMLNGVDINPLYDYNKDSLKNILNNFSKDLSDGVQESSYYIEDKSLIITLGHSGAAVDVEKTVPLIENTFSSLIFAENKIELQTLTKEPDKLNAEKLHQEVYKEAKDAYYTSEPFVVYPSENGVDFKISVEEAQNIIDTATESEVTIPLKTLYPKTTTNMIGSEAFPDLLGSFSTKYAASNTNRTTNLKLASGKINGHVLLPGETFSYNKVVGERTIAAGYKEAAVYQNGEVVQGLGGGICQISTTLFNSVLFANLGIVELHNHQFVPSYVTAGRDATVVYGVKDFKFKNTRKHAIKISSTVSGGVATIQIWGKAEDTEYDVSVNASVYSRTSSYIKSTTYRVVKQNGTVIKNEKIASYTYKVH